jgi:hypothetical protein
MLFEKETYGRETPCVITQKSGRNCKMTEVTINVDRKVIQCGSKIRKVTKHFKKKS